ncbi:glycosyltransferase [Oceanobacillus sp. 143]|uniref:Glycosyltransferase family 1 protein n=1 Tax=Oceanobacillus zhaokaii TaxID=2052660 RepID=A0A345PL96_9BACI|nr:glycosyltransferase family 1 protein [Oceanobacillus zhaokaii]AXI10776.1 glycosyltransferase family 1 protein [Oceanobacillus zhaokaii]QGS69685.1 glycosyltransferase [Oceanobacillus sp. 143]
MKNEAPLKILQVVGAMNMGGTETMLMNIYRHMNRDKVQFDFISYSSQEAHYDQEIKALGGSVIKLSKTNSIKEIYNVIKRNGPYDAVHAHTLFNCGIAIIAAYLAGVKLRISHAHTTLDNSNSISRKAYITSMRAIINLFSTNLLACSNGAGTYLFGKNSANREKYSYFPNVIDYSTFLQPPHTEVRKFNLEAGLGKSIIIGHVGRFIEAKNHAFLLEIMKSVIKRDPSIKLLLVGDGDLRLEIEEKAKNDGLLANIKFVGIRTDISTMLHNMDVFVFPSIHEGLGLVLLEAQASGTPCVVSEAIQPEADLDIGLVSKLSIANGPEVWVDKIIEVANKKEKNVNKIIDGFEKNGYSLALANEKLMKIYRSSEEVADEKYVDHLL